MSLDVKITRRETRTSERAVTTSCRHRNYTTGTKFLPSPVAAPARFFLVYYVVLRRREFLSISYCFCCHVFFIFQVQQQLKHLFNVEPTFVKRNIEDLINKDYLHRLEGKEAGKEGYKYVA